MGKLVISSACCYTIFLFNGYIPNRVNMQKHSGMTHLFFLIVLEIFMLMSLPFTQNLLPYDLGGTIVFLG